MTLLQINYWVGKWLSRRGLDNLMIQLDGTANKGKIRRQCNPGSEHGSCQSRRPGSRICPFTGILAEPMPKHCRFR